jgi:hypothetical protein
VATRFISSAIWAEIGSLIPSRGRTVTAAVSYVGHDGPEFLRLHRGDSIVVDGSDESLRAGRTSYRAIERWIATR